MSQFLLALMLVCAGVALIRVRSYDAPEADMRIRGDSDFYIDMARRMPLETIELPFRFRFLLPWTASLLPLPPHVALAVITYASLVGAFYIAVRIGRELGYGGLDTLLGVLFVFVSPWSLYQFTNPYLLDGFVMLAIWVALYAALNSRIVLFTVAITLGTLVREAVIFIAPAYFLVELFARPRDWSRIRRSLGTMVLPVAAFLLPRWLLVWPADAGYAGWYRQHFSDIWSSRSVYGLVIASIAAWGWLWVMAVAGMIVLNTGSGADSLRPGPGRRRIAACNSAAFCLLAGAVVSAIPTTDTGRMYFILAPIMAIGASALLATIRLFYPPAVYWLAVAGSLVSAPLIGLIFTPNVIFPPSVQNAFSAKYVMVMELVFALALAFLAIVALRRDNRSPSEVSAWNG